MNHDGSFMVVWDSADQDNEGREIYAQCFNSDGEESGDEFRVNPYTTQEQFAPDIAVDDAGNYVVVWQSHLAQEDNYGIAGQRFDSSCVRIGEQFHVNTYTSNSQLAPSVAMNGIGKFVVTWQSEGQDGDDDGIFARLFEADAAPASDEFQVNSLTTGYQEAPDTAMDAQGNFTIVWSSEDQDGDREAIMAQQYDSDGEEIGTEFLINEITASFQYLPGIAMKDNGEFVVAWSSDDYDAPGDSGAVAARLFRADGDPVDGEFQVNDYSQGYQGDLAIAVDNDGNFFISYDSTGSDGDDYGIQGRYYTSD